MTRSAFHLWEPATGYPIPLWLWNSATYQDLLARAQLRDPPKALSVPFAEFDHLNCAQVSTITAWRAKYLDSEIMNAACFPDLCADSVAPLAKRIATSGISPDRLTAFLLRNARPSPGAA